MTAAAPSSISPQFRHGAKIAPRFSPPSPITVRSPRSPRFSAAYTSTAEREREREREKIPSSHYCGLSADYMATASASLYDVLGLSAGATCQEIKQAYRRLARACHPDVVAADYKDTSADRFMRIHAAYSTLSDPNKRADYDCFLLARRRRFYRPAASCSSAPSFSRFGRRTWETDQCW